MDGSVLFASLLRKIGIEPFLVVEPEHCYVGFYLDEKGEQPIVLETTLIGAKPEADSERVLEDFPGVVEKKWADTDTWATFVAALQSAADDIKENGDKFEEEKNSDYQLIPIAEARRLGILPIPFAPAAKE